MIEMIGGHSGTIGTITASGGIDGTTTIGIETVGNADIATIENIVGGGSSGLRVKVRGQTYLVNRGMVGM